MNINQEIINKLASKHEPRTKNYTYIRGLRRAQYEASNQEIRELDILIALEQLNYESEEDKS